MWSLALLLLDAFGLCPDFDRTLEAFSIFFLVMQGFRHPNLR